MTESGPTAAFPTAGKLAEHLADRAYGTASAAGASRSLLDILSPLFQRTKEIAKSIGAADGRYSGNTAHDELEALLERCERDAGQAGNSDSDIEDAALAVVAWIDETISAALIASMSEAEPGDPEDPFGDPEAPDGASQEIYRLQTSRFEISDAGVRVFDKLGALEPGQDGVREVYVAVLQLGFRGQYFAEDDRRQLDGLKQEHAERLLTVTRRPDVTTPEPASPAAKPIQTQGRSHRKMLAAAAVLIAVVGAAFAYNWYSGCAEIYGADCTHCTLNPENCFH